MYTEKPINNFTLARKRFLHILFFLAFAFIGIYGISYFTSHYLVDSESIVKFHETDQSVFTFIFLFLLVFLPFSYGLSCLISGRWLVPNINSLIMFMGMMFLFASTLEILLTKVFVEVISRPSWIYHVWPVHEGSTSGVKFLIWPWYGFHYYFMLQAIQIKNSDVFKGNLMKGFVMPFDAMALETLANVFSLLLFNSYYFYYLSPEFYHFTSLEIFIPYFLLGALSIVIINYLDRKKMPRLWIGIVAYVLALLIVFGLD